MQYSMPYAHTPKNENKNKNLFKVRNEQQSTRRILWTENIKGNIIKEPTRRNRLWTVKLADASLMWLLAFIFFFSYLFYACMNVEHFVYVLKMDFHTKFGSLCASNVQRVSKCSWKKKIILKWEMKSKKKQYVHHINCSTNAHIL